LTLAAAKSGLKCIVFVNKLERDLCEGMFRRPDGAQAIVATPTLAQGLNLPAHFAILAGDKRSDAGGREDLKAHELLNAAARAGRAGHLANGLVLLIPDPIIHFDKPTTLSSATVKKLRSILPEDDHCVLVSDPLEVVLDRLMVGNHTDPDVRYTVNRFAVLREVEDGTEDSTHLFDLTKSFGSYLAHKRKTEQVFTQKVATFKTAINAAMPGALDSATAVLATQSGLSAQLLMDLRDRIRDQLNAAATSILGWLEWTLSWLDQDETPAKLCLATSSPIYARCWESRPKWAGERRFRQTPTGAQGLGYRQDHPRDRNRVGRDPGRQLRKAADMSQST
jgi:hypothetical protein